ncbi:hypothetical protein TIFTF001_015546 [Ficus carica]|uniref:Uncharacterized protein n=1 Tax=Ficus carica TaxID=3494 RepID=A0AA88A612_FICCA|nr:hypothetical protein TIFTF001_015546 [Ficus carica]
MNEIVGGGMWLSCTEKVLQQLGFGNPVSPDEVSYFYAELAVTLVLLNLGPRLIGKIH